MPDFKTSFKATSNDFRASMGSNKSGFVTSGTAGGTMNHQKLINRDKPNCHPINAITGLDGELTVRPSQALTNIEIAAILAR